MGTTDESLARTRLENRRSVPGWRSDGGVPPGAAPAEVAPFLAQVEKGWDTARLAPGNRLKAAKRLFMRLLRFHTDRQSHFNRNVAHVLAGLSSRIGLLAGVDAQVRSMRSRIEAQGGRLGELEARVQTLQAVLPAGERGSVAESPAEDRAGRRGLHSRRVGALYRRFEDRFRGSADAVGERVRLYVPRIANAAAALGGNLPVLDVGCGRGELLGALMEAGVRAEGVEANPRMADACEAKGIPVRRDDLFVVLGQAEPASLAAVTAIQVVEHFGPEDLLRFLELAHERLAPGGLLVLETIDVRTLFALRWYFADPTHRLPLMPETLSFWVETAGFVDIEIHSLHPVDVPTASLDPEVARLHDVVFGPQDFSLFARCPEAGPLPDANDAAIREGAS